VDVYCKQFNLKFIVRWDILLPDVQGVPKKLPNLFLSEL